MRRAHLLNLTLWAANAVALTLLVNVASQFFFFRWDVTDEQRHSLKPSTRAVLESLREPVFIEVFLEGDLNAGFTRLQKAVRETLGEFQVYSNRRVRFVFTDPLQAPSRPARSEFMSAIAGYGIQPVNIVENKGGQRVERLAFPGATVTLGGRVAGVNLLKGNRALSSQEVLNQSAEIIEYELISAIYQLANQHPKKILWLTGHGQPEGLPVAGITRALEKSYVLETFDVRQPVALPPADVLVVCKPTRTLDEPAVFKIDQFVMQGGKVLWLLDRTTANMDSARRPNYFALPFESGLESALFRYGVRINPDLVQDRFAAMQPIVTGVVNGKPQMQPMPWPFFPLVNHFADHPATRNLDAVYTRFISSVDTVRAPGVKKTAMFFSSPYAKRTGTPAPVHGNLHRNAATDSTFRHGPIALAWLLEGTFTSAFANRFAPDDVNMPVQQRSAPTRMIVVGDGDWVLNEVRAGEPQPTGKDPHADYLFANEELALNLVAFLADEEGLIQARNKQVRWRPLNTVKVKAERLSWQLLNVAGPVALLALFGWAYHLWRKKRYASF
jgi:gliding-associated putative ABC transporter substrate-binding component GldG